MRGPRAQRLIGWGLTFVLGSVIGCQSLGAGRQARGQHLYDMHCRACHGAGGRGDGYVRFQPPVADLTSPRVQERLDEELLQTVHRGRPNTAMGTWALVLSEEEVHDVVSYARTLGKTSPSP